MAGTFSKKTSGGGTPPAGSIRVTVANIPTITLDDAGNLNYVAANATETTALRSQCGIPGTTGHTWWLKES